MAIHKLKNVGVNAPIATGDQLVVEELLVQGARDVKLRRIIAGESDAGFKAGEQDLAVELGETDADARVKLAPTRLHNLVKVSTISTFDDLIDKIGRKNEPRGLANLDGLVLNGNRDKPLLTLTEALKSAIIRVPEIVKRKAAKANGFIELGNVVHGVFLLVAVDKAKWIAGNAFTGEVKNAGNDTVGTRKAPGTGPKRGLGVGGEIVQDFVSQGKVSARLRSLGADLRRLLDKSTENGGVRALRKLVRR